MLLQINEPGQTPASHADDVSLAVGIDLGTTNSVVAIARDSKPEALRDDTGGATVPSVVAYPRGGGAPIVGEWARRALLTDPDSVVGSIKRLMGRGAEDVRSLAGALPYAIEPGGEGGLVRLNVAGRILTPVEISADILRALKQETEIRLGKPVARAVVTTPAYFDDAARAATRDAARMAGLEVLRLVNEPTAAALAYGLDRGAEGLYAVYDLGGGTFDMSLLRLRKGVFQVLATGGDSALGGDDFDHLVAERFFKERDKKKTPTVGEAKLTLATARLAKEWLSSREDGVWEIELAGESSRHRLDRAGFEDLIAPLIDRTLTIAVQVMEDADVTPEDVKGVVLVGGSTRTPLVRRKVAALFGSEPLCELDPDEVVALGAALQAEALTVGSDTLLLDVAPLSLGIETMGGIVEKVVERNTAIPVAKAQEFTTYRDGQSAMKIHVLQGERETVDECRSLGHFILSGIPPMTAGAARIEVTFTVDADGLLTVSAQERTTGVEQRIEVKPSYGLTEEEMAQMLRDSMVYARDDMERRLLIEARVEAERAMNALIAALNVDGDLVAGDERAAIDLQTAAVRSAAAGKDRDLIDREVEALERVCGPFAQRRMDKAMAVGLSGLSVDAVERMADSSDGKNAAE